MKIIAAIALCFIATFFAERSLAASDSWAAVSFLEGRWEARTTGGAAGAQVLGTYSFKRELKDHILSRESEATTGCKGPQDFDCNHHDMLYVYQDTEGAPLNAIYFDNEGHVIHYEVTSPAPNTAVFLSPQSAGPQFRLTYELRDSVMSGKFQMRMPGQAEWKSYLEWTGAKK